MAWYNILTQDTDDTASGTNINSLMENIRVLGGNGTSAPSSDIEALLTLIQAVNTDIHSVTADYTVLDADGYRQINVDSRTGNVVVTLPTAADNTDRPLRIFVTHSGGKVTADGEGAETINDVLEVVMQGQYNYVDLVCDGTEWWMIDFKITYDTGWIARSDWTNVHVGTPTIDYDNLSGTFTVGELITADSGATGIIQSDTGSAMQVKMVTGDGEFVNDEEIVGGTSGATADVDMTASTKNTDDNLFHDFATNSSDINVRYLISTDGTENNSFEPILMQSANTELTGVSFFQVDTDNIEIQTGSGGIRYIDSNGAPYLLDNEDYFFKAIAERIR